MRGSSRSIVPLLKMTDSADSSVRRFRPKSQDAIALADLLDGNTRAGHEGAPAKTSAAPSEPGKVPEIGGRREGPEPTRYGDWEKDGRCIDF